MSDISDELYTIENDTLKSKSRSQVITTEHITS